MAAPKLTVEQAMKIRRLYSDNNVSYPNLASRFGVSIAIIGEVIRGIYPGVTHLPNISRTRSRK